MTTHRLHVLANHQNRLALGIVRAYCLLHSQATLADLRAAFPKTLHTNPGVPEIIADVTQVPDLQSRNWHGYFNKPDELIPLADGTRVALTSMWPLADLQRLMGIASSLGIIAQLTGNLPTQEAITLPDGTTVTPVPTPGYRLLSLTAAAPAASNAAGSPDASQEGANASKPALGQLVNDVAADIAGFFAHGLRLPYNERDLQVSLGGWLMQQTLPGGARKYDDVFFEYYVPTQLFPDDTASNPWGNASRMNVDIVVERDGEYLPIELKYATKAVPGFNPGTFGVSYNDVTVLKTQGMQNLIRYNYWKDVHRIELVRQLFSNVRNGIALLLTNDPAYQTPLQPTSANYEFATFNGPHGTSKRWRGKISPKTLKRHPDFALFFPYTIQWQPATILWQGKPLGGTTFQYSLIKI